MKIITWNINRASYVRKKLWKYLNKLNFDIGLFQEVYMIPYWIRKNYHIIRGEMNAILINKNINGKIKRGNIFDIHPKNEVIIDSSLSCEVELLDRNIFLMSIYNYIGPDEKDFSEFLESLLEFINKNKTKPIIIGGDFNMDEEFQSQYKRWGILIRKVKKELNKLGFKEVLSEQFKSKPYTFISPRNKRPYQLDYLFIQKNIKLDKVIVGSKNEIFHQKPKLSDHLPILATIEL